MSLREELLQVVPGHHPTGEYLRYEPIYEEIKEARREDLDIPQGEWQTSLKTADWPLVIRLTTSTLAKRSKDLQLAAWLTEALLRREGFAGLRDGLDVLAGLIEEFWEGVYPELEDEGDAEFRAAPLDWVGQYLDAAVRAVPINRAGHNLIDYQVSRMIPRQQDAESDELKQEARRAAVEAGKVTPEEFDREFDSTPRAWYRQTVEELDGATGALDALERVAGERFGSDAPSFIRLRGALQEVRQHVIPLLAKKQGAEPDPVELEPTGALPTDGSTGMPSEPAAPAGTDRMQTISAAVAQGAVINAASATHTLDDASARVASAARFLRSQSPADPAPYLLLRGYRWGELRRQPGEVDPRLLEAPPTELRSRLKTLLLEENWTKLLESAEEVMAAPYGRGWLDLQRYVITACDALGREYAALGIALRSAIRALIQDVPQLPRLTLMDDSPTANAETLRWLHGQGLLDETLTPSPSMGAQPVRSGCRDPLVRAEECVRAGDPRSAIELLMGEAAQEQSRRGAFLRRLQAAQIMVDSGLEAVATPMLEEMAQQVEAHSLESWEAGEVIAQPLSLLYRCMQRLDGDQSDTRALFVRISRLDPLRAIELSRTISNG